MTDYLHDVFALLILNIISFAFRAKTNIAISKAYIKNHMPFDAVYES